ncbi:MAG: hypothetical protein ACLFTB_03025 [Desulfovibrionales bacterium]
MAEQQEQIQTLERGSIYFFYRPRVEEEDPDSVEDVERMYMVLSPAQKDRYRLAVIGRKQLPDPSRSGRDKFWGFVSTVRKDPKNIDRELQGETYTTKTRGTRHLPAARPLGEGVYRILRHEDHTHFVYALELPHDTGDVQEEFRLEEEASYVISIKNPQKGSPQAAGLSKDQQAEFPKALQEVFRGRRFADANPPEFLDRQGTEFLLIAASGDVKEELGITLHPEREEASSADIFKDLKMDRHQHPVEPLFEGEWA